MISLYVQGFDETIRRLDMRQPAIKKAVVNALNHTGSAVLDALKAQMPIDFDRPVPYTLNSLRYGKATPARLFVEIRPADWGGKGTSAKDYLGPEIFGGERQDKRSERALKAMGVLPDDMYTAPGRGATFDAYGNQSVGEIRQILSYFQSAQMTSGHLANMTDKTRARLARGSKKTGFGYTYFAIRTHKGNLAPGIYKRMNFSVGHAIKPVLMFVKRPRYAKRYRWHQVGRTVATQMFPRYLTQELDAMKTGKGGWD